MAKKKKTTLQNEPWESNKPSNSKFTKICDDMQDSDAWHRLTLKQQGLYLFLKKKYRGNNENDIHITEKDKRIIHISDNTLWKDLDALIDYGFIKVVFKGRYARKPNIYGFSAMWRKYGTDDFFVHPNDKRMTKANSYKG